MPDQVYCVNWNDELKLQNYYDNLGRVTRKSFNGNKDFGTVYTYENVGSKETTTLIKSVKTPILHTTKIIINKRLLTVCKRKTE